MTTNRDPLPTAVQAPAPLASPFVDDLIPRDQLARICGVSSSTLSRWMLERRLPPPDVAITRKAQQWRRSSLHAAGIKV
jgi:transcriptional regulator with XRE-family HTH domain